MSVQPTREAVLAVVKERLGQWHIDEIDGYLMDHGWLLRVAADAAARREDIELAVSRLLGLAS